MNWSEELRIAADNVLSSPRTTAAVATATGTLGGYNLAEAFQGALSTTGIIVGIMATLLLSRNHWITYKNAKIQNLILLRQLADMGAEPITEKLP